MTTILGPMVGAEYDAYRKVLAEEAGRPPEAWTFKGHPAYRKILEHVSPAQGIEYLAAIQQQFPHEWRSLKGLFLRTAADNDALGAPVQADFPGFGTCSPTNLRYLYHALRVWRHIQQLEVPAVHIVELGGGYGGLALFLHRLMPTVSTKLWSYTIVDVPEAGHIQAAFARECTFPLWTADGGDPDALAALVSDTETAPRVLVSAYGFSEFSTEVRTWYEHHLVQHCPHGWLLWNMIPVYPFTTADLVTHDEVPLTGLGNKVVRY